MRRYDRMRRARWFQPLAIAGFALSEARHIRRGRQDHGALVSTHTELFAGIEIDCHSIARELAAQHRRYVRETSTPSMAVSLEAASLLRALCERLAPSRILDLGSGFSSIVLGDYALGAGCDIVSVDDDRAWLDVTTTQLESRGLPNRLITWDEFRASPDGDYDLIFNDLGGDHRLPSMRWVADLVAPSGILIVDDMQLRGFWSSITSLEGGVARSLRPVTLDCYGRWSAVWMPRHDR